MQVPTYTVSYICSYLLNKTSLDIVLIDTGSGLDMHFCLWRTGKRNEDDDGAAENTNAGKSSSGI